MNETLLLIIGGLTLLNLFLLIYCFSGLRLLRKRFQSAFANLDETQDLAETIITYFEKINAADQKLHHIQKSYEHLSNIATKSLQKIAVVRFNPFRNTGGDQSFVLALLDNHDSGLLLTSIHSREGTRVYVKPVEYGTSEHTLSAEEQAALKKARLGTVKAPELGTSERAPAKTIKHKL